MKKSNIVALDTATKVLHWAQVCKDHSCPKRWMWVSFENLRINERYNLKIHLCWHWAVNWCIRSELLVDLTILLEVQSKTTVPVSNIIGWGGKHHRLLDDEQGEEISQKRLRQLSVLLSSSEQHKRWSVIGENCTRDCLTT